MGSLRRRLVALEDVASQNPQTPPHRSEAGRRLLGWLEGYSARKRAGTLTVEDEAEAEEIHEALKRRRQELQRSWGVDR